jgi:hypothetical protein
VLLLQFLLLLLLLLGVSFFSTPYRFKDMPRIVVSFLILQMLGSVKLRGFSNLNGDFGDE